MKVEDRALTQDESLGPRERILSASLELFTQQGYFNTNIPDISKKSRCSVGSIYHHFINKEEIANQLYKDGINEFRSFLAQSIDPEANLENSVRSVVVAFLTFAQDHRAWAHYLWLARHTEFLSDKVTKPTVVGFDTLGRRLTRTIKAAIRQGEIPNLKAEVIWSIVFGIPLSFVLDWLDGFTNQSPIDVAPVLARACWSALRGA